MRFLPALIAAAPLMALALPAAAEEPVVVELFTSQGCSSCPPAEAYLRDVAKRKDVVALEWHVDYWDDLRAGSSGKWKDPFSSPQHTARQRAYNETLRGTRSVYTPQAVVMGSTETVGSRRKSVSSLIDKAKGRDAKAAIEAEKTVGGVRFAVTGAPEGSKAMLISFKKSADTRVRAGENTGRDLSSANVVTAFRTVTPAAGGAVETGAPKTGEGCALLVSAPDGEILAARYCPA